MNSKLLQINQCDNEYPKNDINKINYLSKSKKFKREIN